MPPDKNIGKLFAYVFSSFRHTFAKSGFVVHGGFSHGFVSLVNELWLYYILGKWIGSSWTLCAIYCIVILYKCIFIKILGPKPLQAREENPLNSSSYRIFN